MPPTSSNTRSSTNALILARKPDLKDTPVFLIGMLLFTIMHGLYLTAFLLENQGDDFRYFLDSLRFGTFVFAINLVIFIYPIMDRMLLNPGNKPLIIPVFVYLLVLSTMVFLSLGLYDLIRKNEISRLRFWLIYFGAILFWISDVELAFDMFVIENPHFPGTLLNSILYFPAQFLFAASVYKRVKS